MASPATQNNQDGLLERPCLWVRVRENRVGGLGTLRRSTGSRGTAALGSRPYLETLRACKSVHVAHCEMIVP